MPDPSTEEARAFYEQIYEAIYDSQANSEFSVRLFGRDMGQHGFAEVLHLDHLLEVRGICTGCRVLDLGCGNGKISEYLSDMTGAVVTGIDFISKAIQQAFAAKARARYLYLVS